MTLRPPRRPPEDELRIVVLYCLRSLAPCSELQLLQFLSEYDLMNYFDMMFALNDLCSRGQAVRKREAAGWSYTLTEAGHEVLSLFGNRVPHSVQTLVQEHASAWRLRFEREAQCSASTEKTERGDWEVTLSLKEQDGDMMRLTLALPSRELASAIGARWPDKAGEIYETVIRILAGEGT